MQASDEKPPYVMFEVREVEDRDASIAAGRYVSRDIDIAIITPSGSKDRTERPVEEWFSVKQQEVQEGRFSGLWLEQYRLQYKRFKEGLAEPETGTSLLNWPVVSPSQRRLLIDLNIRTVEDVASMTEEAMGLVGIGARALKQKAADYIAAAEGPGKLAERLDKLEGSLADLTVRNESLENQLAAYVKKYGPLETESA